MRNLLKLWLLLLFSVPVLAQNQTVTGKVTSSDDGSAIPGVSVVIKGTTRGTTTDANGAFQVTAANNAQLTFSYVGFKTVTVTVGNRNTVDVKLEPDASSLNEVVVTALGVVRQQKELGSATEVVKADKLVQARATNIAQALSGKVAGLQINTINNGVDPQTRIVLRGNRSLLGNNQALVVIDGTQVPQDAINYLNPNDIENVSVLKGANAAALYGSDASNGALLITTKKGSVTAPRINYSNTTSIEQISFLPKFNDRFGAGTESYSREYIPFENQSYGPEYDGSTKDLGQTLEDGTIAKAAYSYNPNGKLSAFDQGLVQQNDLSLTSGDQNGSFLISLQDVNSRGVVPGDLSRRTGGHLSATRNYGRFSGTFNVDYRIKDVDRSTSGFYNNILNTAGNIDLNQYRNWQPLRLDNGQLNPANPNNYFNDYFDNPFFSKDINRQNRVDRYLTGNVELRYKAAEWLQFLYRVGVTNQNFESKSTSAKYAYSAYAKQHIYRAKDLPGGVTDFSGYEQRINQDFFFTANKSAGPFKATLIGGFNLQERKYKQVVTSASALVIPDLYNVSNRVGEPGASEFNAKARLLGAYGDLTVGFKDFLFLHMSGRNDWSSILGANNRSFFYPGADLSFVITDAVPSLKNGNILSSAKLRAAATRVGQINLPGTFGAYQLETVYTPGGGFPYGGLAGFTLGNTANNPNIQPEFLDSYEVGAELAFLGDRITLDMSYYTQQNTNQTVRIDVSPATGYSGALINTGRLDNNGFEVDLKTTPVRLDNGFRWDLGINYSQVNTNVVSIVDGLKEINLSSYYGVVNSGLYQIFAVEGQQFPVVKVVGYERERDAQGNIIPGGRVVVDPASGYPLKSNELINLGRTNPRDRLGINTTLRYKGFSLSGTAEYRGGNVIAHGLAETMWFTGAAYATTTYGRERFVFPNSVTKNADGTYTANTSIAVKDGGLGAFDSNLRNFGENFVTNGAFWKLRELAINYTVSPALLQKTRFIKNASVGLVGRNLVTLLPKENIYTDPEFNNTTTNAVGVNTNAITPPTRTYGFTVQLGF
ncbi:SusC/RagA family TonB-linked outer membrane protein [Fibrella sp. HMF5335]|uniref:SusC/RagA family TonB-linked outer membrane protein n=1 Tax=Fibrella rubiginis TaxID=2817060 RepID=A0A939GM35_9BACT|nr:SusC/RagA family TonB-linked outer membrane protein [Fibrella rubiginis]MBO0938927.1 SusC/RagA family TonB-linked outer membrane protein [Fibrella rubiginis]